MPPTSLSRTRIRFETAPSCHACRAALVPNVLAAIQSTGALEETRRYAEAEAKLAIDAISVLPPSIFKEALLQLSDFAVRRKH